MSTPGIISLQVDPAEVWLRSEQDSRAFFPHAGHFNLQDAHLLFGAVLGVEEPNLPLRWHAPLYFQGQQTWNPS